MNDSESAVRQLPVELYSAAQVRELDRIAIEERGIPGLILMRRAAEACWVACREAYPDAHKFTVLCGSGNNAGDGYLLAGLMAQRGMAVQVFAVGDTDKLGPDALETLRFCRESGIEPEHLSADVLFAGEVLIDALLGTGARGEVRVEYVAAIDAINDSGLPVVAVDLPSGLSADTGFSRGVTVKADVTVTFIGLKRGLFTADGSEYAGRVCFAGLDLPADVLEQVEPSAELLRAERRPLGRRHRNAHKGKHGHLLVVGGNYGMAGAVLMAGEAAMRCGSGLVSVATRPGHAAPILSRRPELMVQGVDDGAAVTALLQRATAIAIGPGLGTDAWARDLLGVVQGSGLPMVLDADALNLLAETGDYCDNWILTPHPGEAARLWGAPVQSRRFEVAAGLQVQRGGVVVLKGAGTLVASDGGLSVCPYGNPGMSVAGMGDILTGVVGAMLAQGLTLRTAAETGVVLHARAGDLAAAQGERGLLATDLLGPLRELANEI